MKKTGRPSSSRRTRRSRSSTNTVQWARVLPADAGRRAPPATVPTSAPCTSTSWPPTPPARSIVPVDDLAKALGLGRERLHPRGVEGRHLQGRSATASRSTCTPSAMYYNTDHIEEGRHRPPRPTDEASLHGRARQAEVRRPASTPFWMPNRWPAHLMFLSLLWQNGGEPYAEDGTKATFDSRGRRRGADLDGRRRSSKGYSPKQRGRRTRSTSPSRTARRRVTWDGIWQINDLKAAEAAVRLAPIPTIGEHAGGRGRTRTTSTSPSQAPRTTTSCRRRKVFIDWMSEHSAEWAGAGMVPGAQVGARDARRSARRTPGSDRRGRSTTMQLPAADPGPRRRRRPRPWRSPSAEAVLGKQEPGRRPEATRRPRRPS